MAKYVVLALLILCLMNCAHENNSVEKHKDNEGSHETVYITQYTKELEVFIEHSIPVVNEHAEFLIHLTYLKDFSPVKEGVLDLEFINSKGTKVQTKLDQPTKTGIYTAKVIFNQPGKYKIIGKLTSRQVSDPFEPFNMTVDLNEENIHKDIHEEHTGIKFSKEQQWNIDFNVEAVGYRKIFRNVNVTGEILAKPEYFSKVVTPLEGIVLTKNNTNLKNVGSYVEKGEYLLNISPSVDVTANLMRIKNDYLLAKYEYNRVKTLFARKVVSAKEFEKVKFDFESKQISYNSLVDQIVITENGFAVVAPISGYIENINFTLGDQLEAGQALFSILNSSKLQLKANVPSSYFEIASQVTDACFTPEGFSSEFTVSQLNGRKLSVAAALNSQNRTVPVYFEFDNPNKQFRVGMFSEIHLRIGKPTEFLAIPENAVVNEDGINTAYVQLEGELFEKRLIKTGDSDEGFVQVLQGLNANERVVTKGAYQVRLADLSPNSSIGHGHAH